jgi:type IV pilus assembly protein PilB
MAVRLGELLLRENRVTPEQLEEALAHQRANGGRLGASLVKLGFLRDDDISRILSRQYGVPAVMVEQFELDLAVIRLIPAKTAIKYQVLPISRSGATLTLAMTDPTNVFAMDDIKFMTGLQVEPVVASETAVLAAIDRYYSRPSSGADEWASDLVTKALEDLGPPSDDLEVADAAEVDSPEQAIDVAALERESGEAPIIRVVNALLLSAIQRGASDIHLEPYEKELRVRFRIDGVLVPVMSPALKYREPITSRIKAMARLDIAERRLPQDGRIKTHFNDNGKVRAIDFRVSCLPTLFGEKIVMRVLDPEALRLDVTRLGFEPRALERFTAAIRRPSGMVLVTGPTGSGKTNTLYSSLAELNRPGVNIMTAEDPVEFNLLGVNQVQVHESIGLTFGSVLRSLLRQDPNVIFVSDVHDQDTASMAIKAALTGHLVLSALHTDDAPSSIRRLVSLGVEPFLVASSISLICAQRLVRRICEHCKEPKPKAARELIQIGFDPGAAVTVVPHQGRGCPRCGGTGYRGRLGVFEVMEVTDTLRQLVIAGASVDELKECAIGEGMDTLRQAGLHHVAAGLTTVEEIARETGC